MSLEVTIKKRLGDFTLNVDFSVETAPIGLLGPSGSGKSLTLRAIAGLETPDSGRIVLHGRVLFDSDQRINLPARARRVGFLFQNFSLFPHLTVAENIAFGLERLPSRDRAARIERQVNAMHLEGFSNRLPGSLSGGEQQRVALARALATEPAALLLDEPFSALDTHLRSSLERQLRETLATYGGSTIFVSHNLEEAYRVCEKLIVLSKGSIAASGPKEEIFAHPPTMDVARLTGCKNYSRARIFADHVVDGRVEDRAGARAGARVEALDWTDEAEPNSSCILTVSQPILTRTAHVAIRAHHIRVHGGSPSVESKNQFPGWLAAMAETPFRATLDLKIGSAPKNSSDFHVQAEIFKQEWESFRGMPQPWTIEFPPDRLFLLPD